MHLHPEIAHALDRIPPFDPLADPAATRAYVRCLLAAASPADDPQIAVSLTTIPGPAGDLTVRIYRPTRQDSTPRPGVLYFHGGAFVSGDLDTGDGNCRDICLAAGAVIISVDYRLAPEHPYPAAFDDCYAALRWTAENADALNVDPTRLAVAGRSAGGALAAAVALAARDRSGPDLVFQLLLVPALDDRCKLPSIGECIDDRIVDGRVARGMWKLYLGSAGADQYAAPARAQDLAGLPPAYLEICQADALRDEALEYGRRLMTAGVHTELHVVPGAFHLFEGYAPDSQLARRATASWTSAITSALV
ncbi:alpha/beta hydrolase [Streptomyces olivochromogenes]|uniref:alpha/beta hydrolase n=1 Tax=Streptomyces olivochromogenes TaxID=1963 RepID=UPI001F332548|nr:alpha/beta hydrolase [Streptomyces olivochromogenes]